MHELRQGEIRVDGSGGVAVAQYPFEMVMSGRRPVALERMGHLSLRAPRGGVDCGLAHYAGAY